MMRLTSALTLILGLCLTAEGQTAGEQPQMSPSGTYNETVPYRSLRGTTPDACAASCEADNLCRAWTLTPPTFRQGPRCELKTAPDNIDRHPAAISGVDRSSPPTGAAYGQPMGQASPPASTETLAGSSTPEYSGPSTQPPVQTRPTVSPQSGTPARAGQSPAAAAERVPDFSEMRITVESYPPGYEPESTAREPAPAPVRSEPAAPQTAPSLKQAPPRVETQPDTETSPVAETGTSVQSEPTQRVVRTRRYTRTLPREMVTTREDAARQSGNMTPPPAAEDSPDNEAPAAEPEPTVTRRTVTPQQEQSETKTSTARSDKPAGPWPGLKRTQRNTQQAAPSGDRPLPGLRKDGAYSVQEMDVLPGDYEDNAGLQGRLPSGHNEAFDKKTDDEDGDDTKKSPEE